MHDAHSVPAFLDLLDGGRVEIDVTLVPVQRIFMLYESICVLERYAEDVCPFVSWYYFMLILRVQVFEQVKRRSRKFAYLFEVKHLLDMEGVDCRRHLCCKWLQAVLLIIFSGIKGTNECWAVASCLSWKIWPQVPELAATASLYGLVNISCTAVI